MDQHPTGTVTFLFTDIEGSTKLAREFPETWESARSRHHQILREAIESNNGFVFQIIGDAFCVAFPHAAAAIKAAVAAQQGLQSEAWGGCVIRARMGIHTGEAKLHENEYQGYLTLSLAQRIMASGHGGQILISGATENLVRDQLPKDISLQDLGKHAFRDVPQPVRVFQVLAPSLSTDFPALRATPSHPNNLPTQLTSFVGREKELADLQKLLLDTHILTLIGPGGTGKTRLSIQVASALLDRFPDGLWLVELAPILDPLLVPRVTAMTMGLRDEPQRPVIDMLCDYLREKKMLLILDNCEHLVDACAHMADRILHAAPHVRILASSREALGIGGEVTYRVPSLDLPDLAHLPPIETLSQYEAVKLFIDRARSAVPSFSVTNENAPAVAQICYRLDGIPLAIELAAAKVRALRVDQIAKRLDDRFRLLTGGSRTALERHQTLRAAIDWSYNLLPPAEQALFRRLAVFVGGWTLEAAEFVCQGESVQNNGVMHIQEQLINKSLVSMDETQAEPRYSMLETIRQYANEKLVEAGKSVVMRDLHLKYFLMLAETAEPYLMRSEQLEWLAKLDADYENLRLALEWAISKESAEPSLRLCAALGKFWALRGYWMEGVKWLEGALAKSPQNDTENIWRVRALCQDAGLAELLDDLQRMKASAELALMLAQDGSDKRDTAIAKFYVGFQLFRLGEFEKGRPFMEQSLVHFQELRDSYWEAYSYRWLCMLQLNQGGSQTLEQTMHSIELARKSGDRVNLARAFLDYADWLFRNERTHEAKKFVQESEEISKQISPNLITILLAQLYLARIEWLHGNRQQAQKLYHDVHARLILLGERLTASFCGGSLGLLAMEEGDFDQAQIYFEEGLSTARELALNYYISNCLGWLGILFFLQGSIQKSKQYLREGIALTKELDTYSIASFLQFLFILPYFQMHKDSVRLLGAFDRFEEKIGYTFEPLLKPYSIRTEERTRALLGEAAFDAAFAEGQKLSLEESLALAQDMIEAM